jgi:hypothetical protein
VNDIAERALSLVAPDRATLDTLRDIDAGLRELPQIEVTIDHLIHGGMYGRTAHLPAGVVASGTVLRRATVLVLHGDVTMFTGTEAVRLTGFHVLPGLRGRKALFRTHAETHMTMVLPSDAQSVDEAEADMTDETALLAKAPGNVTITKETP